METLGRNGRWTCAECSFINLVRSPRCSRCDAPISERNENQDWPDAREIPERSTINLRNTSRNNRSTRNPERRTYGAVKSLVKFLAKAAGVTTLALGGIALALPALGFGAAGVTAGSIAAGVQASYGGTIVAGSAFSVLQSVGAAGLATGTKVAVGTVCAAIAKKL